MRARDLRALDLPEATRQEVQFVSDQLLQNACMSRERALELIIGAESDAEAEKLFRSNGNLTGGGGAPGRVGTAAWLYENSTNGSEWWFGDTPQRWRYSWTWSGPSFDENRLKIPRLFYVLEDVPTEEIRHARVTLTGLVRQIRDLHMQPALFEEVA